MKDIFRIFNTGYYLWFGAAILILFRIDEALDLGRYAVMAILVAGILVMGMAFWKAVQRNKEANTNQGTYKVVFKSFPWQIVVAAAILGFWAYTMGPAFGGSYPLSVASMFMIGAFIGALFNFALGTGQYIFIRSQGLFIRKSATDKQENFIAWKDLKEVGIKDEVLTIGNNKGDQYTFELKKLRKGHRLFLEKALTYYEKEMPEPLDTDILRGEF